MREHRITLSAPEVEALIKCLEALFDNEHLSPMARTLHKRIVPMVGIGSSGQAVSSKAEAAAETSKRQRQRLTAALLEARLGGMAGAGPTISRFQFPHVGLRMSQPFRSSELQ